MNSETDQNRRDTRAVRRLQADLRLERRKTSRLSASVHFILSSLSRIGIILQDARRNAEPINVDEVCQIIDRAYRVGGKSALVPLVDMLAEARCPQCGEDKPGSEDLSAEGCSWCDRRAEFVTGQGEA